MAMMKTAIRTSSALLQSNLWIRFIDASNKKNSNIYNNKCLNVHF
jgi:hypothetical protein